MKIEKMCSQVKSYKLQNVWIDWRTIEVIAFHETQQNTNNVKKQFIINGKFSNNNRYINHKWAKHYGFRVRLSGWWMRYGGGGWCFWFLLSFYDIPANCTILLYTLFSFDCCRLLTHIRPLWLLLQQHRYSLGVGKLCEASVRSFFWSRLLSLRPDTVSLRTIRPNINNSTAKVITVPVQVAIFPNPSLFYPSLSVPIDFVEKIYLIL